MTALATIGIAVRSREDNPWLDRLLASLERHPPGLPGVQVRIEEGGLLTKVEKMNRLLRACPTRYLAILEDDAELLHAGWLANLVLAFGALEGIALVGASEARKGVTSEEAAAGISPALIDVTNLPGFCVVLDREAGLEWDVRVQTMSDLYVSLLARSQGLRCAVSRAAFLRHTKEPWAPDDLPPWEQSDRNRFGEADAYYARDRHQRKRLAEARFLLERFGDLARQTLPQEILAVLEPEAVSLDCQPGCTRCRNIVPAGEDWVMSRIGPLCFRCRFGDDVIGTLHVSAETAAAVAEGE